MVASLASAVANSEKWKGFTVEYSTQSPPPHTSAKTPESVWGGPMRSWTGSRRSSCAPSYCWLRRRRGWGAPYPGSSTSGSGPHHLSYGFNHDPDPVKWSGSYKLMQITTDNTINTYVCRYSTVLLDKALKKGTITKKLKWREKDILQAEVVK